MLVVDSITLNVVRILDALTYATITNASASVIEQVFTRTSTTIANRSCVSSFSNQLFLLVTPKVGVSDVKLFKLGLEYFTQRSWCKKSLPRPTK